MQVTGAGGEWMTHFESTGQREIRALSRRLQSYAGDQADPVRMHDLRMASELLEHLARLTTKLSRPAQL